MRLFTVLPLLSIPVVLYNIIAWSGSAVSDPYYVLSRMDEVLLAVPMASGATWIVTPGHALIAVTLVMLFFELLKSTGTGRAAVMNHAFSMMLFVICLIEFLLFGAFATSVFFLITLMALLDTMAGFMVTIAAARRDFGVDAAYAD
jgi:hypothetical protein